MDNERCVAIDTPDLSNVEESFSGPNGDYYWHLMRRVHRSERRVVEDDICQHSSKGGYTVELKLSEADSGEDRRQTESLLAVSKLLDMPIEGEVLINDSGKTIRVCHARNRNWHLSTPIKSRDKADAFVLTWPMDHNSLAYDVMGWCTLAAFKKRGFAPKLADPPVWMIQWYHLRRMNALGVQLHYDDSFAETNRRLLNSIDHKPLGIDRMIDNVMRSRTPKKWKGQK